jgi:hypothetical protein
MGGLAPQMGMQGSSSQFQAPVFHHTHQAITREKGSIAVQSKQTIEVEQVLCFVT